MATAPIQLLFLRPQLSLGDFRSLELCSAVLMNAFLLQMGNMLQLYQVNHKCVKLVKTQTWKAHIASCAKRDITVQNKETTVKHAQSIHSPTRTELLASIMISSLTSATICTI